MIIEQYKLDGVNMIINVMFRPQILEKISGLCDVKREDVNVEEF